MHVPLDRLQFDAQPGNTWAAQMVLPDGDSIDWTGEFIEVQPSSLLVFTLTDEPEKSARAQVVVELEQIEGGTKMRFAQETPGFTLEQQAQLIDGWQGFLDELDRIVAS